VAALYRNGARNFRLGRQPDLLVYGADGEEFPTPRPELLERLFSAIRKAAPDLSTLHIDNVNPGTIFHHEDTSRAALQAIVRGHTPGDVAAFGMESADPVVVRENNLKALPEEVLFAIQVVNEEGGDRKKGIPHLLPGLNFISGLAGETKETFRLNQRFLEGVLERGLLVRRVNIRQVMPFPGTPAYEKNTLGKHEREFKQFKEWVRQHFDLPMLQKVFPIGTVLRDVVVEVEGATSFGRQMGSYPLLVGIPLPIPRRTSMDIVVVDHGMRSVTGLPCPIEVNLLPLSALRWLPHIGKKRAGLIAAKRPFKNLEEFRAVVGEPTPLDSALSFSLPGVPSDA
ncbi:MAG TPA: radical SAM protein, partial [Methanomicrobiales archaeon]|nr:radical SAM protein [Methanomicrobiales archaeon]